MNWTLFAVVLFWVSAALILYAYAGFPILLATRGFKRRPVAKAAITPRVSLIITAHNEVRSIGDKLENVLSLDYPRERLEVFVASDGSNDGTDAVVESYAGRGVRLLPFPRQGKVATLNGAVPHATGDIVVFSDANSIYDRQAIRQIVQPFADESVGGVAGNQVYEPGSDGHVAGVGERMYWSFDRWLKRVQSQAGNVISSTGAIHAIRRELFEPVPPGVSDDFVLSTRVILRGRRLVFEPSAMAYETVAASDGAEYGRKVRVIVRGLRGLWAVRGLFNPWRHGFYSLQIFSHKLLRWSVGWLLVILLASTASLWRAGAFYRMALLVQLLFYGCALVALAMRGTRLVRWRFFRLCSVPFYFCLANVAAIRAWVQLWRGARVDRWDSGRPAAAVGPSEAAYPAGASTLVAARGSQSS